MTRAEYLQWVKDRALAYLPHDLTNALSSFISDMRKHPELASHPALELTGQLLANGHLSTAKQMRDHIEGFA